MDTISFKRHRFPPEIIGRAVWLYARFTLSYRDVESFNGKLRDELLNVEICDTLWEAKVLAERWRREYNQRRPHSALAYRPPAPEAQLPRSQALDLIPWSGLQMVPGLT